MWFITQYWNICSSFLTGTMPLFSPSRSLFFILCQSASLKYKSVHFIPLFKILQLFPVAHKMKFKLLIVEHPSSGSCLHFQHDFLLLSLPQSAFQQHCTVNAYWNLTCSHQGFPSGIFPLYAASFSPGLPCKSLLFFHSSVQATVLWCGHLTIFLDFPWKNEAVLGLSASFLFSFRSAFSTLYSVSPTY